LITFYRNIPTKANGALEPPPRAPPAIRAESDNCITSADVSDPDGSGDGGPAAALDKHA